MKVTKEDFEILSAAMDEKVLPYVDENLWKLAKDHATKDPVVFYVDGILLSALQNKTCNDRENEASMKFQKCFFPWNGQKYYDSHMETAMKKYCVLRHIDYWNTEE